MKKVVNVTQEHIDKGVQRSPWQCPIARAVKEGEGMSSTGMVVEATQSWLRIGEYRFYSLPDKLLKFMRKFDRGGRVEPFKFFLNWDSGEVVVL